MPSFSQIETLQPPDHVVVPPHAFASTWGERPDEDVAMGLRFIPDVDLEDARIEAYRRADRLFPKHEGRPAVTDLFHASFQDTLLRWIIARGTCDVNNVNEPWPGWAVGTEDIVVEMALTDHGAQLIFDAWERMRIASNIGLIPASDDDIALLPELLLRLPTLTIMRRTQALRLRRLLRFVLEELETVPSPSPLPEPLPGSKTPQPPPGREEPPTTTPTSGG